MKNPEMLRLVLDESQMCGKAVLENRGMFRLFLINTRSEKSAIKLLMIMLMH